MNIDFTRVDWMTCIITTVCVVWWRRLTLKSLELEFIRPRGYLNVAKTFEMLVTDLAIFIGHQHPKYVNNFHLLISLTKSGRNQTS